MRRKKMIFMLLSALFLVIAAGTLYFFILQRPNPPLGKSTLAVGNTAFEVEIANTTTTRARGLSGREGLGENEGMLFIFNSPGIHGFWMKDMKFSIDFVWIRDNRVVGVTENAAPEPDAPFWSLKRYYPPEDVTHVLEVAAGEAAKRGIKRGNAVKIEE